MTNTTPTTQYSQNKVSTKKMIEKVQAYMKDLSDAGDDSIEKLKGSIEAARYAGVESYHHLLADIYAKTDEGTADVKELEHILKGISAKAKKVGITLGMELKEKISSLT